MNVFEKIYQENYWGFGSGHGSLPSVTAEYSQYISNFISNNNITSVVDFGCGDWQFSRFMDWRKVDYTGYEIVPKLVKDNTKSYAAPNIKFLLTPSSFKNLKPADLLLVKDVLQHLPQSEIENFITSVLPKYKYSLITNNTLPENLLNMAIEKGGFRPLDLRLPPYNLSATAVFDFGKSHKTYSKEEKKYFDPWHSVVLLYRPQSQSASLSGILKSVASVIGSR
jgi:hypothetical protein